jgi:hypothetical protein
MRRFEYTGQLFISTTAESVLPEHQHLVGEHLVIARGDAMRAQLTLK